ncbi:D-3-phosphoglycerate dehydrogenase [Rhodovulum sp. PH10]|uniref:NAD(P)-dependent oxidoreductase n=1 Tax=Rhodovulum sp. PH10 TaxID=1187851 RepID=UPI00027C21CD|nr:NAD(P)-dependent oxidoreductase [Rhodovulum sp. PH10]EJW11967.1 D-3-phosphoglycerate dehydrogenase [Rhodovulum sp. PH10]
MKTLFIDCNHQLAPIFARVHGPDDPPIAVNAAPFTSADLPHLLAGCAVCIDDHSYLPTEQIAACTDLRHVVFLGTGASSYMDISALEALGVTVHTIRGYANTAVAEHTIALMVACARDVARMDRAIRAGIWRPLEGMQLEGKVLGVVGLGGIGREVARLGAGLGMRVVAWNRTPRPDAGVPEVDLDTLLSTADVVSLNLGLNDDTRGMIGAEKLARMKDGALLINTARAALVDEAALIAELTHGRIRAALDVFHAEPLRADHPLARLEGVTLTAHAAFRTPEASEELLRRAIDIVRTISAAPAR